MEEGEIKRKERERSVFLNVCYGVYVLFVFEEERESVVCVSVFS